MTRPDATDPPDWALPSWDSIVDGTGITVPNPGIKTPGAFGVRILGVSEATRAIRDAVRSDPRLGDLWVEGEISRVTISSAGHAYFALKDERSQLQCVWFRDDRVRSAFEAQPGLRVVAHGRMDLYEPNGGLQLYVESIQPAGVGDLALRFEALKARLAAEGLFETARKRRLPPRPATIAVITSPTGVVWKDAAGRWRGSSSSPPRSRARVRRPAWSTPSGGWSRTSPGSPPTVARTRRRPSRSWPAAAAPSKISGRSTTSASSGPSWAIRCRSCPGSATNRT